MKVAAEQRLARLLQALAQCDAAIRQNPNAAMAHCNRGFVLQSLKRFEEALASFDRALALAPRFAEAHYNRGGALKNMQRLDEALQSYDRAIALKPNYAEAWCNRGNTLRELERPGEALQSYDRAIVLRPDYALAFSNRGSTLRDLRRHAEALQSFEQAIALKPDYAPAHVERGNVLTDLGRAEEAIRSYDRVLMREPGHAGAHNGKGNALRRLARLDEALASYDRAVAGSPDFAEAHANRGNALKDLARFEEALASYDRAIALKPGHVESHWNKSICKLLTGEFDEGWRLYEWRKKKPELLGIRSYPKPVWAGEASLAGKTLFIRAEQAFGDTIQFCRYALLAEADGAKVILAVQRPLMRLLGQLDPKIEIVDAEDAPPDFDCHAALLSMPLAYATNGNNPPARVPYLRAEPDRVEKWKSRVGTEGLKIGIAWQGARHGEIDVGRSFPVRHFDRISRLPNVRLISLQKYAGAEQLRDLPAGMSVESFGDELDAGPDAFVDTAAVIESIDLVITSDTAIAHLAGALGRPAWVGLKQVPDWRWRLNSADSPWYPSLRLFRQRERNDWATVFAAMETELVKLASRS